MKIILKINNIHEGIVSHNLVLEIVLKAPLIPIQILASMLMTTET